MTNPQPEWGGEERRSIPIHIINYMRETIDTHVKQVTSVIHHHTEEEMERYGHIVKQIEDQSQALEAHANASVERHNELVRQLTHIVGRQELMENSYPKDANGNPDYQGHLHGHTVMIQRAEDEEKLMAYVRERMKEDNNRKEDVRFVVRSIIATVCGLLALWAGKELIADAVRSTHVIPNHVGAQK